MISTIGGGKKKTNHFSNWSLAACLVATVWCAGYFAGHYYGSKEPIYEENFLSDKDKPDSVTCSCVPIEIPGEKKK